MKEDLQDFHKLFSNNYFNFSDKTLDPFLIQTSILPKKNLAAGGGLRTLKSIKSEPKAENNKIILPLND
jgi:hypothetical protein